MKKSIKKQLNTTDMEALKNDQLETVAGGFIYFDKFPWGIPWNDVFPGGWPGGLPGGLPGVNPGNLPGPFGIPS